jgi:hypothetical protein
MGMTILTAENMTLTTGIRVLAVVSTAAAGSLAANVRIKRVEISQRGTSTLQQIGGAFSTRTGSTVTATSTTPQAIRPLNGPASGLAGNTAPAAAAGRSGTNVSVDTTPTYVDHHYFDFANLNGYLFKPDPEEEIMIPASTIWCVRLLADPTTLTGWTVSIILHEF